LVPDVNALAAVKLLHTAVWALFAASIVALPITAVMRRFDWAAALTALVLVECGILAVNRGRCPLTGLAARYTSDRTDNFDIYLPKLIARYNKVIFGFLFLFGEGVVLWRWLV